MQRNIQPRHNANESTRTAPLQRGIRPQRRSSLFVLILAAIVVVTTAEHAFAWGAATHAQLAGEVLGNLSILPGGIAAVLARYGWSYIFGNIAADVVLAKRMSRVKQFCHHWSTGFRLYDQAPDDREKAFALGYLSHLAADTVAHNKYVPRQLSITRTTLNFGHLYWEMRADATTARNDWQRLEEVMAQDHENHHAILKRELTATLLPYQFNRLFFDRLNRLMVRQYFRRCLGLMQDKSRWPLEPALLDDYRSEATDRIMSLLSDLRDSAVLKEDPNGTAALHQAKLHRRENRVLRLRGLPVEHRALDVAAALAPMIAHPDYRPRLAACHSPADEGLVGPEQGG